MTFNYADSCLSIQGYTQGECPECEREYDMTLCDRKFGGSIKCLLTKGHSGDHYGKWSPSTEEG